MAWSRRLLIAGCVLASVLALWRIRDAREVVERERLAVATFGQALQLQSSGRRAEAAEAYRATIANAPLDPDLYEVVALAQFRLGRIDDAVATYRQILEMYPYTYVGPLYRGVGLIELKAGRISAALVDLSTAVTLDPSDWLAYHLLAHARKQSGDAAGARAAWVRVLELNPDFHPARDQLRELGDTP